MGLFKFADIRRGKDSSDRVGLFMLISYIILFLLFLVLPLGALISKSLQNKDGEFVGLRNYNLYLQEPALFQSLYNSLFVAICSTVIVVVLAFLFSFTLVSSQALSITPSLITLSINLSLTTQVEPNFDTGVFI